MYELPMFPLEQTVLPTALVPLHVFEPRYRTLARFVTARDDPEFGITLIERGREVGGEDQRSSLGVVARILESEEFPDGRWGIVAIATRPITVAEWLPDDPFPRAQVRDRPDVDVDSYLDVLGPDTIGQLAEGLDRIHAAAERLDPGRSLAEPRLADDPAVATWQAAVASGLGPLDASLLLAEDGAIARAGLAIRLIAERAEILEALADRSG